MGRLKKRADGYYCAWYMGKQFVARTEKEAIRKRDDYRYECEHGIERPKPMRVFEFAEKWLSTTKANVQDRTYNDYARHLERLTDVCGDKLLSAVTPMDIATVWKNCAGLSDSLIKKCKFLYVSMFRAAMENGYCRYNPAESSSAKPHKGTTGTYEHRCLTDEEIDLILNTDHPFRHGVMFMLYAGLRRGELIPLTKADIREGRIHINKGVSYQVNQPVMTRTKNASSRRSIPLFQPLQAIYDDLPDIGYILPGSRAKMCTKTVFNRTWRNYLESLSTAAGHPVFFRPHDCRVTFITNCRDHGVDIHTCMDWCGHTTEKMILQVYDRTSPARELVEVNKLYQKPDHKQTIVLKTKQG